MSKFDFEAYEKMVAFKATRNSTDILANAGAVHASIAMSKLLEYTDHSLKMVVGSFDGTISNRPNYISGLTHMLNKEHIKVEIIFINEPNAESQAYQLLLERKREGKDITFKIADKDFIDSLTIDGHTKHFSVHDDNKFRFEKDTQKYLAWFSFNDRQKASKLKNIFDSRFKKLPELALQAA